MNSLVVRAVILSLQNGAYVATACQFAGLKERTYTNWNQRGREAMELAEVEGIDVETLLTETLMPIVNGQPTMRDPADALETPAPEGFTPEGWRFAVFAAMVEKARAMAEVANVRIIQQASKDSWQAAAWLLERTHPERYARRDRLALEGSAEGEPIRVQPVGLDDLEKKLREMQEAEQGKSQLKAVEARPRARRNG